MALLWFEGYEGWTTGEDLTEFNKKYTTGTNMAANEFEFITSTRIHGGIAMQLTTADTDNQAYWTNIVALSSDTTFIVGMAVYIDSTGVILTENTRIELMAFLDTASDRMMTITIEGPDLFMNVRRGNVTGAVLAASSINLTQDTWYYVEFKVTFHDTTGSFELRLDSVNVASDTNVDTTAGTTAVQSIGIGAGRSMKMAFDDVYFCDSTGSFNNDFLDDVYAELILPNGNGTTNDFTGSDADSTDNYLLVDEVPSDGDTTYTEDTTVGNKDLYQYEPISTSPDTIYGAMVVTDIRKTDTDGRQTVTVCRSVATEEDGATQGLTQTYFMFGHVFETDPDTSALWLEAAINAAEFGVKITA